MTTAPDSFISPAQWTAVKNTIGAISATEAEGVDLPDWFFQLRDHLARLVISGTEPVEPFEVTEHFMYLLDMYVAGAMVQDSVADGSRLVIEWANNTLDAARSMGILPIQGGTKSVWLVVHAWDGDDEDSAE